MLCELGLDIPVTLLVGRKHELVCEVEWYQLDVVGLTSTHSVDSGARLLEKGWTLSYSRVAHVGEASGHCGNTHEPMDGRTLFYLLSAGFDLLSSNVKDIRGH